MLDYYVKSTARQHKLIGLFTLALAINAPLHANEVDVVDQTRHTDNFTNEAYITDIGTLLYHDRDNDRYFSGLSLTIDADTPYRNDRVYASIDLIGPDQIIDRLHTTADFTIYRNSVTDEYRIDIDLVRSYLTAFYDLQIGLHDASDDRLLDRVGGSHFSNLRQLPLESEDFDLSPVIPPNDLPPSPVQTGNDNIRVDEYGGSAGVALLMILFASMAGRRTRHSTLASE